jgi:hypothetical protein
VIFCNRPGSMSAEVTRPMEQRFNRTRTVASPVSPPGALTPLA